MRHISAFHEILTEIRSLDSSKQSPAFIHSHAQHQLPPITSKSMQGVEVATSSPRTEIQKHPLPPFSLPWKKKQQTKPKTQP